MIKLKRFTFNAFQENSYIAYNDAKEAIIFDPGCSNQSEREVLTSFIEINDLKPVQLVNTHCHIDHVLGNQFVANKYDLPLEASPLETSVLSSCTVVSQMYGMPYDESPDIKVFLDESSEFELGTDRFRILLCPGHSPGSLCFYNEEAKIVIGGDVLFQGSIGRTDLPGGDYNTLITSIRTELFALPDDTVVFCGHGPETTIGQEKRTNPFLT